MLCLCQFSGSISFGHQFLGGSFMNSPARQMPKVMIPAWIQM